MFRLPPCSVHMVFDLSSKVDICFETQFSIVSDARCARTRLPVDLLHIPGISLFEMENICSNLCFRISICEMENICCIYVFLTSGLFAVGVLVLFPSNDVFLKSRSILTASPPLAILPRPPLPFLGNNPHLPSRLPDQSILSSQTSYAQGVPKKILPPEF